MYKCTLSLSVVRDIDISFPISLTDGEPGGVQEQHSWIGI